MKRGNLLKEASWVTDSDPEKTNSRNELRDLNSGEKNIPLGANGREGKDSVRGKKNKFKFWVPTLTKRSTIYNFVLLGVWGGSR